MGDHRRARPAPAPYAGPHSRGYEQPPLPAPPARRRKVAPTVVTAFSLALAPAAAGLALVFFPAVPDGRPPEKPLIQVVPRPAVADTSAPLPIAPPPDATTAPGR